MADIWYLGFFSIIIGLLGHYSYVRALSKMSGDLRKAFVYFFLASSGIFPLVAVLSFFGVAELPVNEPLWELLPVLFFLTSIFFASSMKNLVKLLDNIITESEKLEKTEKE